VAVKADWVRTMPCGANSEHAMSGLTIIVPFIPPPLSISSPHSDVGCGCRWEATPEAKKPGAGERL